MQTGKKELLHFGLLIGGVLGVLASLFWWKGSCTWPYLVCASGLFLAAGVLLPSILAPVYKVWMMFAEVLGWIMTRVLLVVLFYLVITPIGVFARLFGKKFLDVRWRDGSESYWRLREPPARDGCERQF